VPCREHLAQLRGQQRVLDELGATVLVVSFEPPEQAAHLARSMGLPYSILSDPKRQAYRAFGLGQGERERLWSWETAGAYLRGLRHGYLPRRPAGDVAQLGADFVLDREGRVVFAYRGRSPADRPAVATVIDAVRRTSETPHDVEQRRSPASRGDT
jgi:peroxiredoxin